MTVNLNQNIKKKTCFTSAKKKTTNQQLNLPLIHTTLIQLT